MISRPSQSFCISIVLGDRSALTPIQMTLTFTLCFADTPRIHALMSNFFVSALNEPVP